MSITKDQIIEAVAAMSVMDVVELISAMEEKFGVSAAAAVAVAAGPAAEAAEEKTDFTVVLTSAGENKIGAIKEVRAFTGLGLKEAKDLVEAAPKELKQGVAKKDAEELQKKFAAIGAKVDLK